MNGGIVVSGDAEIFDVLIVGAGPAGATAAIRLASQERSVKLIDAAQFPRSAPCAGWLGSKTKELLNDLDIKIPAKLTHAFKNVTFHSADLSKTARPNFETAPGILVDRNDFDLALIKQARSAGAKLAEGQPVAELQIDEDSVTATLADHGTVTAKLLILATGRSTHLFDRIGLAGGPPTTGYWAAEVRVDKLPLKKTPTVDIVLGLDRSGAFGVVVAVGDRLVINVHCPGQKSDVIPTLISLCRQLDDADLVPGNYTHNAARATVHMTPAAAALGMDTHVAKRTLIVGDAGGFVSAASGEGIYPAMWSARIAAEVINDAIDAPSPQDVLMQFNTRWRTEMAEYLQPPNTDLQYLLPLIFSNQPMTDRMGAAFFSGENI